MEQIFHFSEYWQLYFGFIVFLLIIVVVDLGVFHRTPRTISLREATNWSMIWISLAFVFNFWFYRFCLSNFLANPDRIGWTGKSPELLSEQFGLEFLTGYLVEKSLAIDNIFIFVVIFNFFSIPKAFQHRILFFGILGAILLRGFFIGLGSSLLHHHWILILFGIFLILTGIKLFFTHDKETDLSRNKLLRIFHHILPISYKTDKPHFFTKEGGKRCVTPLLLALLMIECSDILFAVDSIPAIFAITKEPFIVFSSNMMALLGLRSLYFLLAESVDIFYLLKYGLGTVLVFIGIKMVWLNELYGGKFPIAYSLIFVTGVIASSMLLSALFPQKKTRLRAIWWFFCRP